MWGFYILFITLVTPIAATFSPNVFVPFPVPNSPATMVPSPSMTMPRLITWTGGGGASVTFKIFCDFGFYSSDQYILPYFPIPTKMNNVFYIKRPQYYTHIYITSILPFFLSCYRSVLLIVFFLSFFLSFFHSLSLFKK